MAIRAGKSYSQQSGRGQLARALRDFELDGRPGEREESFVARLMTVNLLRGLAASAPTLQTRLDAGGCPDEPAKGDVA